jgi:hypothetical protein
LSADVGQLMASGGRSRTTRAASRLRRRPRAPGDPSARRALIAAPHPHPHHPKSTVQTSLGAFAPTATPEEDHAMSMPKSYRTIEEFEREELSSQNKAGFSLDDLMQETMLHQNDLLFDDQHDEYTDEEDDDEY